MRREILVLVVLVIAGCGRVVSGDTSLGFEVETPDDLGVSHLSTDQVEAIVAGTEESPLYSSVPATSGPHAPSATPCGIFRQEIPEIFNVHSLEHGVVIIYYNRDEVEPDALAAVEEAARQFQTHIIVMPRSDMPTAVAFVAWGHLAARDSLDVEEVRIFWGEFAQRGPESSIPCNFVVDEAA